MRLTRRRALGLAAAAAAARLSPRLVVPAAAQEAERHGMSAFGDLALPADFKHFPYVNPDAPKGGRYSEVVSSRGFNGSFLTFNSLNGYILKGNGAFGMDLTFAALMVRAGDEPDAMYGLAARGVRISGDGLTYTFTLRPEAKFHDGSALTAQDVVWSLTTLKVQGHPLITPAPARHEKRRGKRRSHRRLAVCGKARPRRAPVRRRAADLLASLL